MQALVVAQNTFCTKKSLLFANLPAASVHSCSVVTLHRNPISKSFDDTAPENFLEKIEPFILSFA